MTTTAALNQTIDVDQLHDLLEDVSITQTIDLGVALVHRASHPTHGALVIIATDASSHLALTV